MSKQGDKNIVFYVVVELRFRINPEYTYNNLGHIVCPATTIECCSAKVKVVTRGLQDKCYAHG